jgi:LmbE family N-acetylglucosaminyl deacetylase
VSTVVHVSPHPDDEALGAPATLLRLRRAGWQVVNAVVSFGRTVEHERRRDEAIDAAQRAGFVLVVPHEPFAISSGDDLARAEPLITAWVARVVEDEQPALVVSPSPSDVHPGHEVVARATRSVIERMDDPVPWLTWGLWAELSSPNVYVPFDDDVLTEARHVLAAYEGELARNDYARLLEARSMANAVLGSERVFGFGSARASTAPYAELLADQRFTRGAWIPGPTRAFDPGNPV